MNVSDPSYPTEVGFHDTPGQASDVVVKGRYAYIADGTEGLRIINVSDPIYPSEESFQDTLGQATSVSVEDNIAYIADRGQGLIIIYLLNPDGKHSVITTEKPTSNVVVKSDLAFIAVDNKGLLAIDVSNSCSEGYAFNNGKKTYVPMNGTVRGIAVPDAIKRPISSILFEFFFWGLLLFPILGLTRLIHNRVSLRRINSQLVLGTDRPFWLALILLFALAVFHIWTLTWS